MDQPFPPLWRGLRVDGSLRTCGGGELRFSWQVYSFRKPSALKEAHFYRQSNVRICWRAKNPPKSTIQDKVEWEGCRKSRRRSRDTYTESYITKDTSIRRNRSSGAEEDLGAVLKLEENAVIWHAPALPSEVLQHHRSVSRLFLLHKMSTRFHIVR